jgi:hypothetical protein
LTRGGSRSKKNLPGSVMEKARSLSFANNPSGLKLTLRRVHSDGEDRRSSNSPSSRASSSSCFSSRPMACRATTLLPDSRASRRMACVSGLSARSRSNSVPALTPWAASFAFASAAGKCSCWCRHIADSLAPNLRPTLRYASPSISTRSISAHRGCVQTVQILAITPSFPTVAPTSTSNTLSLVKGPPSSSTGSKMLRSHAEPKAVERGDIAALRKDSQEFR